MMDNDSATCRQRSNLAECSEKKREEGDGMRKSGWVRKLSILLVFLLLPIGGPGGAAVSQAAYSANEMIELHEPEINRNNVVLSWTVFTTETYVPEVSLYWMTGDADVPIDPNGLYTEQDYGNYTHNQLEPGTYRFELRLRAEDGSILDEISHMFDIPWPVSSTVYVFGTDQPIEDLEFQAIYADEEVQATADPDTGKGYVSYTVAGYPGTCFELISSSYNFSNAHYLCIDGETDFVVQALETDVVLELRDFNVSMTDDTVDGWLFVASHDHYDEYMLKIVDRNGQARSCWFEGDIEEGWYFTCDLSGDPSHLRIDVVQGGDEHETNAILLLDQFALPENLSMQDMDQRLGRIHPWIEFESGDETGIAMYRIVSPDYDFWDYGGLRYIPANGQDRYMTSLRNSWAELTDAIVIQFLDRNGNLYARTAEIPVVDNMRDLTGNINYESEYGLKQYADTILHTGVSFTDMDMAEGKRSGLFTMTLPITDDFEIFAYDLYFASYGDDGIKLLGADRVNVPAGLETFEHWLQDVPEGKDWLAVKPLIVRWEEDSDGLVTPTYYYTTKFLVPLNDWAAARLDQLTVNQTVVTADPDHPLYYEFAVPWDAEEAVITASSSEGIVYIDGAEPGSTVTQVVYLYERVHTVPIEVRKPDDHRPVEYRLTIMKQPEPEALQLTSLTVNGQPAERDDWFYQAIVPYDTEVVMVYAEAAETVEITMQGAVGTGSASAVIPITGGETMIPIMLHDPVTHQAVEYVLYIVREAPHDLVLGVQTGWYEAGTYGFVPKWMTAGVLKGQFVTAAGTMIDVRDSAGNSVMDGDIVPPGAQVVLVHESKVQTVMLYRLSDYLRYRLDIPADNPLTFAHIASLAIRAVDLTGDGVFDQRDLRLLLMEMAD